MTRVLLRVGRLVVHGSTPFDTSAFTEALAREIGSRLPAGADARELARRFAVEVEPRRVVGSQTSGPVVDVAARGLAGRLVR